MVLAGFSQGGAMTLFAGLQLALDQKLAGLLVMSGYLPATAQFKMTEGLESTPILHTHGTGDMVVRHAMAVSTKTHLEKLGFSGYNLRDFRNMGHTVDGKAFEEAARFMASVLPPDWQGSAASNSSKEPAEMSVKELKEAVRAAGLSAEAQGFTEKKEYVDLLTKSRK
jgi:hypothetical protein